MSKANLRLVDLNTGEVHSRSELAEVTRQLEDSIAERQLLEEDLHHKRALVKKLQKQLNRDHQDYERFPLVESLFAMWQQTCNHPRSIIDNDRADAIRKILLMKRPDGTQYTERDARLAILGAARQPFTTGSGRTKKRHDALGLIFRNAEKFEDFATRGAMWLRLHPEDAELVESKYEH